MKTVRVALPVIAVVLVLGAYAFYGSVGTFDFPRVSWDRTYSAPGEGYYSSLAEGYRRGQLNMAHEADPGLAKLHDPWDPNVRNYYGTPYVWDASYIRGKYYLYFSSVPVVLFYLPFRLLRGAYPPDGLAAAFFAAWAFVMSVATVWRALDGRKLRIPFTIWVLLIGFGNLVPLILIYVRVYEVAIIAGMALSATWAYALVRFMQTGTVRQAFWMGFWLALTIAARPNLLLLLLITAFALPWRKWRVLAACVAPLAVVAVLLAAHNYARFRSVSEYGVTYQLTFATMRDHRVCSLCKGSEALRFMNNTMHYVSWAPPIRSDFPYVDLAYNNLDASVSFPGVSEPMLGLGAVNPLTMIATVLGIVVALSRRPLDRPLDNPLNNGTRGGLLILWSAWLILFGLATCWFVVARYVLDFSMLMTVGAVIAIEAGLSFLDEAGVKTWPLRAGAIVLALYSILLGIFLGFTGPQRVFEQTNPAMYRALYDALSLRRSAP